MNNVSLGSPGYTVKLRADLSCKSNLSIFLFGYVIRVKEALGFSSLCKKDKKGCWRGEERRQALSGMNEGREGPREQGGSFGTEKIPMEQGGG